MPEPSKQSSGWATASFTLALLGWAFCFMPVLPSLPAVICGNVSHRKQIVTSRFMIWGLTLGYLSVVVMVIVWTFMIEPFLGNISPSNAVFTRDWTGKPAPNFTVTTLAGKHFALGEVIRLLSTCCASRTTTR